MNFRNLSLKKKKKKCEPPFAASEFPPHEFGKLRGGDVRVRVSLVDKRRELVTVKII